MWGGGVIREGPSRSESASASLGALRSGAVMCRVLGRAHPPIVHNPSRSDHLNPGALSAVTGVRGVRGSLLFQITPAGDTTNDASLEPYIVHNLS